MKKLFFFAAFLCAASLTTMNAQCTKSKTASTTSTKACCAKTTAAMAKAVSADSSIEKKVCAVSGKETYIRNYKCETSGEMVSAEVEFDAKQGTFVNVSPTRGAQPAAEGAAAKSCTKGTAAKSCTKAKKASCSKTCTKAEKAACGMKSTKQASADTKAQAKATLTKGENK